MGVDLKDLVPRQQVDLGYLKGKVIAIDAYNALYQFLAIIRQPDGTPLKDFKGRVTSHLSGLFYRTVNLVELGLKPIYVFDGKPPELKEMEILSRMRHKEEALRKYEDALKRRDLVAARIYAQQTSRLIEPMVQEAKTLLDALGVPWVQAPSEGEAQAAFMASRGSVWAAASQDYDSLLFGAPRLVRNLTISGRRKLPRRNVYIEVTPEVIELDKVLKELNISREQLIDIGILVGTDYNPEGVKGIGPKKALKLIATYGCLEKALPYIEGAEFPVDPARIREVFLSLQVTERYKVEWRMPDVDATIGFLCEEHSFSVDKVRNTLDRMLKATHERKAQLDLDAWLRRAS